MTKLLIIGAGDFQLPLVKAGARNFEILLAAPVVPDAFIPYVKKILIADVRDKEKILEFAKQENIAGVITDQTDIAVRTVAYVAEKLNLPGIGYNTSCLFTDKSLMRSKLEDLGIKLLPNKTVCSIEEAIEYYNQIKGEIIIKPLDTQGSRGVQACSNINELIKKYHDTEKWSSNSKVIIERKANGREFVVEGLAFNYDFENLICGDSFPFSIEDSFSAKSRIFPSTVDKVICDRILDLNKKIIKGFGLKQGITHSEFIMNDDEIYLIETAARGGGVFISSDIVSITTGLNTEEFLVNISTGHQKSLPKIKYNGCYCGYIAFYIPNGEVVKVKGKEYVLSLPFVHSNQLDKLYEGLVVNNETFNKTSRLAIVVSAKSKIEFDKNVKNIKDNLNVVVNTKDGVSSLIWE